MLLLFLHSGGYSQVHIREKVEITKTSVVPFKAVAPPPGIPSGFVIPRSSGLRTSLQLQFGIVQKLDNEMPPYASLNTYFRDSTKFSSLNSHLPIGTQNWWEYYNGCTSQYEWHQQYQQEPSVSTEWDTVGRVFRGDTLTFAYITNRIDQPAVRDTIPILITDTVKVREPSGDSVVVGWNVTLGRYNQCINEYSDHLDAFIGLNCATYIRLDQADTLWGNDDYLFYLKDSISYYKIRRKGCALTCMTMVGQAAGFSIDPGTLNTFMRDRGLYGGGGSTVLWAALDSLPQNDFLNSTRIGYGLPGSTRQLPLDTLNHFLSICQPVIVQVANQPNSINNHWVVVTGKNANGEYTIADPNYADRTTLANYNNRIYAAVFHSRRN